MAVRIKKGRGMMQIPVIPLVDTVFNLLIFFLVATKIAQAEHELALELPNAAHALPLTSKPNEMVINIDSHGDFFIFAQPVTLRELDNVLRTARVDNPKRPVVVRVDRRCRSQSLVTAMDACTRARIRDFRVVTKDPREGAE
jgi:biopolymer transport protein ExbD